MISPSLLHLFTPFSAFTFQQAAVFFACPTRAYRVPAPALCQLPLRACERSGRTPLAPSRKRSKTKSTRNLVLAARSTLTCPATAPQTRPPTSHCFVFGLISHECLVFLVGGGRLTGWRLQGRHEDFLGTVTVPLGDPTSGADTATSAGARPLGGGPIARPSPRTSVAIFFLQGGVDSTLAGRRQDERVNCVLDSSHTRVCTFERPDIKVFSQAFLFSQVP